MEEGVSPEVLNHRQADQVITALEKGLITPQTANRIIEEPIIADAIVSLLENDSPYVDEEVESHSCYHPHFRILTPEEQLRKMLEGEFRGLKAGNVLTLAKRIKLPRGAEMILIAPKLSRMGLPANYPEAIQQLVYDVKMFFDRSHEEPLRVKYDYAGIRQVKKTEKLLGQMESFFEGDFMAFPVQLGQRYAGCSARRTRIKLDRFEFGLPTWVGCCILFSHLERLAPRGAREDVSLHLGFPGDEYKPHDAKKHNYRLGFRLFCGEIDYFQSNEADYEFLGEYGPATGFFFDLR